MSDKTTDKNIIARIETMEKSGAIVEGIHGRPFGGKNILQVVTLVVRESKTSAKVEQLQGGILTTPEFTRLLNWHEAQWKQRMKDKRWRRWARSHVLPEGLPGTRTIAT